MRLLGRTIPSGDAVQSVSLVVTNDEGADSNSVPVIAALSVLGMGARLHL